ncbi:diacylglycerol kinase family protein [Vineibacter terrae]|uniref:diacylglycerol/lipid kinase family protein n=1 Tax=Vineibacter terrae TaxID=2586908 RepID=UPI002E353085|nr:diacylglycerol kinase family protein [Vineibacter terrae]HEX2886168.1 diacylglycerol kinase family protein [Vineibacter terrae]
MQPAAPLPIRRLLVIRNPTAGRRHPRVFDAVVAAVRARGLVVDIVDTEARGDAERLARDAGADRYDAVVAAGGDGTINEVVNGLMARPADDLALGIIALGTANVLAREIGVGTRIEALTAALVHGEATPIMVGKLVDAAGACSCFLLMVGAGFDAHVVATVGTDLKRRFGKGAYVWRSLVEMIRYRDRRYRVTIDGRPYPAASAVVSNGRFYGGPFVVAAAADLRRPILSVCLFERGGRAQVVRYGAGLVTHRLPRMAGYRVVEATEVRIEGGDGDEPVQVDGDHTAALPVTVTVAPRRLRLLMSPA